LGEGGGSPVTQNAQNAQLEIPPQHGYKTEEMTELEEYKRAALKLAQVKLLGRGAGYSAKIPGFGGLVVFGDTRGEALAELASALEGWMEISLRRGDGLPALRARSLAAA
jgi:predicted RNase H-like HicB family nuclease